MARSGCWTGGVLGGEEEGGVAEAGGCLGGDGSYGGLRLIIPVIYRRGGVGGLKYREANVTFG